MRALLIGNMTIDVLDSGIRVGGSVFYGGRALAEYLGIETYALSHIDKEHRELMINTLSRYGIKIIELKAESVPMFIIKNGKAVKFQGLSQKIPMETIERLIKLLKFDIVMLVPIMGELDIKTIELLKNYTSSTISLDIQGLVRTKINNRIACQWDKMLESALIHTDLVHGNIAEYCFSNDENVVLKYFVELSSSCNTAFLISLDSNGTFLVFKGEAFHIPALTVKNVDDVGAGDILLAVTSYFKACGEPILQAAVKGVIAASLKVGNAYGVWFNNDMINSIYRSHIYNVKALNL